MIFGERLEKVERSLESLRGVRVLVPLGRSAVGFSTLGEQEKKQQAEQQAEQPATRAAAEEAEQEARVRTLVGRWFVGSSGRPQQVVNVSAALGIGRASKSWQHPQAVLREFSSGRTRTLWIDLSNFATTPLPPLVECPPRPEGLVGWTLTGLVAVPQAQDSWVDVQGRVWTAGSLNPTATPVWYDGLRWLCVQHLTLSPPRKQAVEAWPTWKGAPLLKAGDWLARDAEVVWVEEVDFAASSFSIRYRSWWQCCFHPEGHVTTTAQVVSLWRFKPELWQHISPPPTPPDGFRLSGFGQVTKGRAEQGLWMLACGLRACSCLSCAAKNVGRSAWLLEEA